jgi:DNA-binding MarR family transcriptional regulator
LGGAGDRREVELSVAAAGTRSAEPICMNSIYFGAKRVFHAFLRITRKPFQSNGITAARFDLMIAVHKKEPIRLGMKGVFQSGLWRSLGVTPSVVCRMLRSLEWLGLIRRRVPDGGDRRQREVFLTDKGLQCLRNAYGMVVRWVQRFVYEAISQGQRDRDERRTHMLVLEAYHDALRYYCRDSAKLYYAWGHPED